MRLYCYVREEIVPGKVNMTHFFIPNGTKMNMVDVAPTSYVMQKFDKFGIETKPVQVYGS